MKFLPELFAQIENVNVQDVGERAVVLVKKMFVERRCG